MPFSVHNNNALRVRLELFTGMIDSVCMLHLKMIGAPDNACLKMLIVFDILSYL